MATYVPGSETYLPDIKPFTPDYKFLSAALDEREDKYNSNWKETNDIYNKVVYADLTREDTNSQREQYANNLAPALEKIAGMDLSLAQNVQSAKAVFAPFFEDELIIKDMVKTANYKKQMGHANRLLQSPDANVRNQYARESVAALQYRMEDFANMSPDEALNAPMYKYVPQADLHALTEEILSGMDPPLSIEMDRISEDGQFVITQKNGEPLVGPVLQLIRKQLQLDPRVIQWYQTKAYVAGRDFASSAVQSGKFSSIQEGQNAWASETISRIQQNNDILFAEGTADLSKLKNINVRWGNYKRQNGIIPGSDKDKILKTNQGNYEKTKLELEENIAIKNLINTPSNDANTTLNRAYELLMMTTLNNDMIAEAQNYSMRDFKTSIEVRKATIDEQFKMDLAKISANAQNRYNLAMDLQKQKHRNDIELSILEGNIVNPNNPVQQALSESSFIIGESGTSSFAVDEDGEITADTDLYLENADQYNSYNQTLQTKKIDAILTSLVQQNPWGAASSIENPNGSAGTEYSGEWSIDVGNGETFTGSIEDIRSFLSATEEVEGGTATEQLLSNPNYSNGEIINRLFEERREIMTGANDEGTLNILSDYPGITDNPEFHTLVQDFRGINEQQDAVDLSYETTLGIINDASAVTAPNALSDANVENLHINGGFPNIMGVTETGLPYKLSKEQYIDQALNLVNEGRIKNVDLEWTDDTGTDDENYLTHSYELKMTGSGRNVITSYHYNPDGSAKMVIDEKAVTAEAGMVYDAFNNALNNGLTNRTPGVQSSTFESVLAGMDDVNANLETGITYTGSYSPNIQGNEGEAILAQLINQKNSLDKSGIKFQVYTGAFEDIDFEAPSSELGEKFLESYLLDVHTYSNPKAGGSTPTKKPISSLGYSPLLGDPEDGQKNTAGYQILTISDEYLNSKLKGALDDEGVPSYSGYSQDEKDLLQKGITIIFDQSDDINPRAISTQWGNKIVSQILASSNKQVVYNMNDDSGEGIGRYTISQSTPKQYTFSYQFRTYNEGGTYTTSDILSRTLNLSEPGFSELDDMKNQFDEQYKIKGLQNTLAAQKDVAVNGER